MPPLMMTMIKMIIMITKFWGGMPAHSCFVEKYEMRACQWENDLNTFLQTIVNIILDSPAMLGYVGGTWWSPSKYW